MLVGCEIGTEQDLAKQLEQIDEVKCVTITYGDYDIVVEAETDDAAKMDDVITSKIRKLQKIRTTITLRVTI
ncbi:MAG: Lrp/AsnC ligand binding domain-containing protein [Nitrosopumilaceae archaeon]